MAKTAVRRAVRSWLANHDKTQTWLASKLGISESMLSRILKGHRSPSEDIADDMLQLTGVDVRDPHKQTVEAR